MEPSSARSYTGGSFQSGVTYDYAEVPSFQATVYKHRENRPTWYERGMVYQIFPDRYARDEHWRERTLAEVKKPRKGIQRRMVEDWNEPPVRPCGAPRRTSGWPSILHIKLYQIRQGSVHSSSTVNMLSPSCVMGYRDSPISSTQVRSVSVACAGSASSRITQDHHAQAHCDDGQKDHGKDHDSQGRGQARTHQGDFGLPRRSGREKGPVQEDVRP